MTQSQIWELSVKKFKNDYLVVLEKLDSDEANETVRDPLGAKFVELQ